MRGEGEEGDDRWAPRVSDTADRGLPVSETEGRGNGPPAGPPAGPPTGPEAGAREIERGVGPAGKWASWRAPLSFFLFLFFSLFSK